MMRREMVEGGGGGIWWWWATASSVQLAAGIASYRRGLGENGATLMPLKAFAIATLFVGAGATAVAGGLNATGIHTVDDMKDVGVRIRRWAWVQSPREP